MLIAHDGKAPKIDPSARIVPTAVICGDVTIGAKTVWGLDAAPPGETIMPVVLDRYTRALARHRNDRILDAGNDRLPKGIETTM